MNAYMIRHKPTGLYWNSGGPKIVQMAVPPNARPALAGRPRTVTTNLFECNRGRVWSSRPKSARQRIKNKVFLGEYRWTKDGYCMSVQSPVIDGDWEVVEFEMVEKHI